MAVVEGEVGQEWAGLWSGTYESHSGWILALLVVGTVVCGLSAAACVCGCRKSRKKHNGGEELHGPKGMIITTNPDESQGCANHTDRQSRPNDSVAITVYPEDGVPHETRPLTTAKRSLPDIPVDHVKDGILGEHKIGSRSVPREMDSMDSNQSKCNHPEMGESGIGTHSGGDTSSDLYATVEDTARDGPGMSALASTSMGSNSKKRMAPIMPPLTLPITSNSNEAGKGANKEAAVKDDDEEDEEEDSHSRYSRLNKEHPYDCLKTTEEHPYAQVKASKSDHGTALYYNGIAPSHPSFVATASGGIDGIESTSQNPIPPPRAHRRSQSGANGNCTSSPPSTHIPAAKAISGGISANQELPYMTPPINLDNSNPSTLALSTTVSSSLPSRSLANGTAPPGLEAGPGPFQQRGSRGNFHNLESQDSNSYTSISVREPIATIKAQTSEQQKNARLPPLRIASKSLRSADPHYASVSDDSDDLYAAIGDQSSQAIYGSGSETYAQIQPQPLPVSSTVPPLPSHRGETSPHTPSNLSFSPLPQSASPTAHHLLPPSISPVPTSPTSTSHNGALLGSQQQPSPPPQPPSVDSLRQVAQVHSRQASSSSATSSTVNLGSPKPEKRQANSPLPPPPLVPTLAVPEKDDEEAIKVNDQAEVEIRSEKTAHFPQNLEEMYAKVIKKNKRKSEGATLQGLPLPANNAAEPTRRSLGSSNSSLVTAAINGVGGIPGRWPESEEQKVSSNAPSSRRKSSEGSSITTSDPDLSLDVRLSLALGEEGENEADWGADGEFPHGDPDLLAAIPDVSGRRSRGAHSIGGRASGGSRVNRVDEGDGSGYESVGSRNGEGCLSSLRRKRGEDDAGYEELRPRQTTPGRGDPGYERVRRDGPPCGDEDEEDEEDRDGEPRYEKVSARGRGGGVPGYETVRDHMAASGEPDYERMKGEEEEPNYESVGYSGSLLPNSQLSSGSQGDSLHNDYESLAGISNGGDATLLERTSESPVAASSLQGVTAQGTNLDAMYARVQKGKKNQEGQK